MLDSTLLQKLENRLIALGLPATLRQRALQELSDHHQDLVDTALDDGFSKTEALKRADTSLGEPISLADQIVLAARRSSWCGRHPILSFGVLPFFSLFTAAIAGILAVVA